MIFSDLWLDEVEFVSDFSMSDLHVRREKVYSNLLSTPLCPIISDVLFGSQLQNMYLI